MKHYEKVRRFEGLVLATVVAIVTLSVIVHATQVMITANKVFLSYNLATGASTAPITPAANQSVLVMGTETAGDDCSQPGVGQVTLLRDTMSSTFAAPALVWTGLESPFAAAITSGSSSTAGTHILYIDTGHRVDLEVNNANTFIVHNTSCGTMKGNITMIW
jgi:hypothetical protein